MKAADIVALYLNPPDNALVISIDEKPGIQALQRMIEYVYADSGKIVRAFRSAYKRDGTLNLFAALEIASGSVSTKTAGSETGSYFLAFMDEVASDHRDVEIHMVLDNYHTQTIRRMAKGTSTGALLIYPMSASWMNQVDIWFSIFSRAASKGASFESTETLASAVKSYIDRYSTHPRPFKWKKRELKGSQIETPSQNYVIKYYLTFNILILSFL